MAGVPEFSESAVEGAIASAREYYSSQRKDSRGALTLDDGHMSILAECITATVNDGKLCIQLPLGIGQVCLPIPVPYNGKVASACLSICTIWGIPTGVRVTVSVAGVTILTKTFGKC